MLDVNRLGNMSKKVANVTKLLVEKENENQLFAYYLKYNERVTTIEYVEYTHLFEKCMENL